MYEERISLQTAILLKEVGYDEYEPQKYGYQGYVKGEKGKEVPAYEYFSNGGNTFNNYTYKESELYPAPNQALVQKWLREKYQIHINVSKPFHREHFTIGKIPEGKIPSSYYTVAKGKKFKTYEEALEFGIAEILKILKSRKM